MEILLRRIVASDEATIGIVYVDGITQCFSLEDEFREKKVAGETRIPAGHYKLKPREFAGMYARYTKKYKWHRGMIEVVDVPGFTDILFHLGNRDSDTSGCILVGRSAQLLGNYTVPESALAYEPFYKLVIDAVYAGECTLTIVDDDTLGGMAREPQATPEGKGQDLEERVHRLEKVVKRFGGLFALED